MQRKKVFISSVQSEFKAERQILFDYLTSDALLGKFFEHSSRPANPLLTRSMYLYGSIKQVGTGTGNI